MKNINIIGVGLIGGSFALDLQSLFPDARILGIDTQSSHIEEAINLGVIHAEGSLDDVEKADLVVLTVPVDVATKVLVPL